MTESTTHKNIGGWLALAVILAGLLCIGGGVWILSWTPMTTPPALAATTPQKKVSPTSVPASQETPTTTATPRALSTLTLSVLLPNVEKETAGQREMTNTPSPTTTATPTPIPPTYTPAQTATPTQDADLFTLLIVHSNDTWGYTLPCG